jgi:ABC-2 type transport system ATP-binding protein
MGGEPVLACEGLRKSYGDRLAVDGVGFSIGAGETYGLLGPNGAGKTTTISMVCGLLARDAGVVTLQGRELDTDTVDVKADIGFVPQEIAIYPDLTAKENLRFFGKLYDLSGSELDGRIDRILETIGLADRANERTDAFSGGMKRRLNIGLGMLNEPTLLLLDEPTVGVDPQSRNAILDSVEVLASEGMAVLYTTHYMEEAQELSDRIAIMDKGALIAMGTQDELVHLVGERTRIDLAVDREAETLAETWRSLPGVSTVSKPEEGRMWLGVQEADTLIPRLFDGARAAGAHITQISLSEPNLEMVFLHLTGRALRD